MLAPDPTWPPPMPLDGWPESPLLYAGRDASGVATDRAQCTVCGEVFSRTSNFDRHFPPTAEVCRDPVSVGLIQGDNGVWHLPGWDEEPAAVHDRA